MKSEKVLDNKFLSDQTFRLRLAKPDMPVRAGQCYSLGLASDSINREYSIYSNANAPHLDVLIRKIEEGIVSTSLANVKPGDTVEIDGPFGDFCLDEAYIAGIPHVFIASGTGIAPFHSFIKTYPELDYLLLHGVRSRSECYDADEYAAERYVPCVSNSSEGQPGIRVTDYLARHPVDPKAIVYICGNRDMIVDTFEILRQQNVPGDNIFTEVFF